MAEAKKKVRKEAKPKSDKKVATKKPAPKPATVKKAVSKENSITKVDDNVVEEPKESVDTAVAKAGKRSVKGIKESEEKAEKEARKAGLKEGENEDKTAAKPKKIQKPARSKLERQSKKLREAAKLIEKGKEYSLKEATTLAIKQSTTKFDATVELHINLGVDPKQADQNIRGTVALPAGTGKSLRLAVIAEGADAAAAIKAGADIAGVEDVVALLDKESITFDVLIATPSQMPKLGKYARLLGPRGLMPNPKSGTVATDVAKAVTEAKAGKVEYRVDSTGIVHLGVGKVSFGEAKLEQNISAVLSSIKAAKPASLKGIYLKSAFVSTTMGPSIRLTVADI